ncbi:MAG TPA: rRNA maturation RNase YbeY [bacterium]|mgnify:CR=1 FL=1|nr:rRNA maturation RNase YbeY [bacterium]
MIVARNLTRQKINLVKWQKIGQIFLEQQGRDGEISLVLVGDQRIRHLNRLYRHKDKVTDVLSFCSDDEGQLGEIIIDYQQIVRQAKCFGNSVWRELIFITTHGILHLLGYDDIDEAGWQEMEKISREFVDDQKIC